MMKEILCLLMLAGASPALAQSVAQGGAAASDAWMGRASHLVLPQSRSWAIQPTGGLANGIVLERVSADVEIVDGAATTTLDVRVLNPGGSQAEAVLLLPVPGGSAGTAVHSFAFEGAAAEPTAELLPHSEARRIYDDIVRKLRDPALLEFAGFGLIRTSVFPVPAGGHQRVRLSYTQILESDGARLDYVLPRSESLAVSVPWDINVRVRSTQSISSVYSPSHELHVRRRGPRQFDLQLAQHAAREPGTFLLSIVRDGRPVNATLFAYPDPEIGGGYFMLYAGLPSELGSARTKLRREVTIVLDRSGSMAGEKLDQALAAARQVIEGLEDGEAFNIVDYSSQVAAFAAQPVVKRRESLLEARQYLASLRPGGGTNIHDALLESLRPAPRAGMLPIVLFLTDGLPTVGRTGEVAIRDMVASANVHGRRVFTFGVGHDVNVPLLDRISDATRALSTYVLPHEDVEVRVSKVFDQLYGPVLSDLELDTYDRAGVVTTRLVRDVLPANLPDLYEGDALTLLGQYRGNGPLRFRLKGNLLGRERVFAFEFDLDKASTRHAFVPRLWAARKIAFLVDQIRQAGADTAALTTSTRPVFDDPRLRELADEILRLSMRFGVLSEYTAFLAREGTELQDWRQLQLTCDDQLQQRAVRDRVGAEAVNQGRNFNTEKLRAQLNYKNQFWNAANERVEVANVQQVCDRALLKRGERWIDTRLVAKNQLEESTRVVELGSPEHRALVDELVRDKRQGLLALEGDILIEHRGESVLVRNR